MCSRSVASPFNGCVGGASSCLQDQTAGRTSAICMDRKEGKSERSFCEVFSTISWAMLMLTSGAFSRRRRLPRFHLFLPFSSAPRCCREGETREGREEGTEGGFRIVAGIRCAEETRSRGLRRRTHHLFGRWLASLDGGLSGDPSALFAWWFPSWFSSSL